MSEAPYNPDDPAFLASRALDEDLTAEERRKLEELLATSKSLRDELEGLRAIDRLVQRWGTPPVECDWDAHAALAAARAAGEDDEQDLRKVDNLLERWRRTPAEVDAEEFTASVMARVAPRTAWSRRRRLIIRLGVPLAAAAALAIAATGLFWSPAPPDAIVQRPAGFAQMVVKEPAEPARVAVAVFDRTPIDRGDDGERFPRLRGNAARFSGCARDQTPRAPEPRPKRPASAGFYAPRHRG